MENSETKKTRKIKIKHIVFAVILAFVLYLIIDIACDPKGAKEAWEDGKKRGLELFE
jgi:hypothetical protein